mmetsp:Transcript_65281/g.154167  ORF Transcript_65281/g.154167 Transcript_65281/m.154167 type:complete len:264 (+) Transcript_65281:152-943(+)
MLDVQLGFDEMRLERLQSFNHSASFLFVLALVCSSLLPLIPHVCLQSSTLKLSKALQRVALLSHAMCLHLCLLHCANKPLHVLGYFVHGHQRHMAFLCQSPRHPLHFLLVSARVQLSALERIHNCSLSRLCYRHSFLETQFLSSCHTQFSLQSLALSSQQTNSVESHLQYFSKPFQLSVLVLPRLGECAELLLRCSQENDHLCSSFGRYLELLPEPIVLGFVFNCIAESSLGFGSLCLCAAVLCLMLIFDSLQLTTFLFKLNL